MLVGNGRGRSRRDNSGSTTRKWKKYQIVAMRPIRIQFPSGGLAPTTPRARQSITSSQKNGLNTGRKRALRTGERSSQGSTKSNRREENISVTPPSLFGTARRIA